MKNFILILITLLVSCKKRESKICNESTKEPYVMYEFIYRDCIKSTEFLNEKIQKTLKNEKISSNKDAIQYHKVTNQYLTYLNTTLEKLINITNQTEKDLYKNCEILDNKYVNEYFFSDKNDNSIVFISKLNEYKSEILKLELEDNFKKRFSSELNTDLGYFRDGKKIEYVSYVYKNSSLLSVLTHLKHKEKVILELENTYLNDN